MAKKIADKSGGLTLRVNPPKDHNHANYHELDDSTAGYELTDSQIAPAIPWKAIVLALALLASGSFILVMVCLMLNGQVDARPTDGVLVLLALGVIAFIPGFYHCRIAYYAYKRYAGYSFDDIPDFD